MIAFLFAGLLLLTNIAAHASGVVLGSYLDLGNAEKAAVAARSVPVSYTHLTLPTTR